MIPSTLPLRSINGPPLLPGLTAASVWTSVAVGVWRMPLTMPRVSVFWNKPSADPIANTSCPTRASVVAPIVNVGCFGSAGEIFNTATSTSAPVRSTRAGTTSPDARRIVTELLPLTTCTFVSRVSGVMKNPLPRLAPASTSTIAGMTCATTFSNPDGSGAAATEGTAVVGLLLGAYSAVGRPPSITAAGSVARLTRVPAMEPPRSGQPAFPLQSVAWQRSPVLQPAEWFRARTRRMRCRRL